MEHSEIAELSNEKEETDRNNSKEEAKSSEDESSNSENKQTDSNENRDCSYNMTIEVSPAADHQNKHTQLKGGETPGYDTSRIHPFMLEGIIEETRRKSYAMVDRDMILSYARIKDEKEDDLPSARDFDENLMMFGGNMLNNKVSKFH